MTKRIFLAALAAIALVCSGAWAQGQTIGNRSVVSTPAVNTQASASAAASGRTHIATGCSGSIATVVAQPAITLSLRDGSTGAGTVLWSQTIACAIGTPCVLASTFLNLTGSASTAMTCEWSGIPAVGNFEVATLTFYDAG